LARVAEALLRTSGLSKRFGALAAVEAVSLSIEPGQVHAIIGPNGAGKSTLLNLLAGELKPGGGEVFFRGAQITKASSDRRSRLGIGRSYQSPNTFPGLSCAECLALASHFSKARAGQALQACGLSARAASLSQELSYGEQRQLEIGMVLATEPRLLLLDEPLAGLGHDEARTITALLREVARTRTLVLVEHDMDAVFSIADAVTVLVNGSVLETGTPAQVRSSRAVREAYLGDEW
jgi:branched-chain amino acid transport system ATP-binding protein